MKAKNPWMAASIRAALRGEDYDPFEGLRFIRRSMISGVRKIENPPHLRHLCEMSSMGNTQNTQLP